MLTDYLLWYRALPRMSKEVLEVSLTSDLGPGVPLFVPYVGFLL